MPGSTRWVSVKPPVEKPVVVYILMGINVFVFVLQLASQWLLGGSDLPAAIGMKVNEFIEAGEVWRLVTPMFLHGSILHIAFNMYALYALGPNLERHYGHWRFTGLYFVSGFAGNVISFLFSEAPSLGSSTAIFGLLGAEGVFLYQNRHIFGATAQRALMNVVVIAAINLMIGLSPGIDNWGHIGGLIGGTLFAWFAGPVFRVENEYNNPSLVDERQNMGALLTFLVVWVIFSALVALKLFL
jgi:rhomboid protease GluP